MNKILKYINDSKWLKHFLAILAIILFALATNIDDIADKTVLSSFDGLRFIYPIEYFTEQAANGEFPLWNINATIGQPAIGDSQNSLFYFLTYLAGPLSPVDFYNIFYCIHIAIAGICAYLYFYNRYKNVSVALCAGFLFMMAIVIGHYIKAHARIIAIISWFPLGFLFIDKYLEKFKFKWIIILAFTISIQFSIGFVQDCLYSIIAYCIYMFVGIIREKKGTISAVKTIALLGIICFGLMAVMLLPLYELMQSTGRGDVSFYYFITGSIHPLEILNTIAPKLFVSSDDISKAVYIGAFPFILALYSTIYNRKNKTVKLFFFMTLIAYCFCGIGYVPIVRKILYQIPILNSFRIPSRALYIYIFGFLGLTIYGITTLKSLDDLKKIIKVSAGVLIFVIFMATISTVFKIPYIYRNKPVVRDFSFFVSSLVAYSTVLIVLLVLYLAKKKLVNKVRLIPIICCMVIIMTVFDQGRFSLSNSVRTSTEAYNQIENQEIFDQLNEYENINMSRVLWGTEYHGYINTGMNFLDDVKVMNYYGAFVNPDYIVTTGDPYFVNKNSENLVKYHNSFLSMLGVRYIVTDKKLPALKEMNYQKNVILDIEKLIINIEDDDFINVFFEPRYIDDDRDIKNYSLDTEGNEMYMISFNLDYDDIKDLDTFIIRIKNSLGEVLYTPEASFFFEENKDDYVIYYYADNKKNDTEITYELEIIATDKKGMTFEINNLKVVELTDKKITDEFLYKRIGFADEQYYIYENLNANDILYLVESVKSVENVEEVYSIVNDDLDKISYVQDYRDIVFENDDMKITDIIIEDNWVSAKVCSDNGAFLNHAQAYYPGWNAYIDGEKTKIYKVNGMIQGIYIPEGEHEILFKYEPKSLKIGAVITIVTICLCVLYFCIQRKKNKD